MSFFEVFLIGVGLAMDSFAVSICKGLTFRKFNWKKAFIIGLYFGFFQAAMPVIGYYLGSSFSQYINAYDHWIAFALLVFIGINMIRESREAQDDSCPLNEPKEDPLEIKNMLMLSIATSIDALAVGLTFAFLQVDLYPAVSLIGIVTLIISMCGVKIGSVFGTRYKSRAELAGGIILICIGCKIVLEHTGMINLVETWFRTVFA